MLRPSNLLLLNDIITELRSQTNKRITGRLMHDNLTALRIAIASHPITRYRLAALRHNEVGSRGCFTLGSDSIIECRGLVVKIWLIALIHF